MEQEILVAESNGTVGKVIDGVVKLATVIIVAWLAWITSEVQELRQDNVIFKERAKTFMDHRDDKAISETLNILRYEINNLKNKKR